MSKSNLLMITTLGLIFTIAESMRFDLQSGHTKCISEDIMNNAVTVGKYNVVNPNEGYPLPVSHKLTVRVISQFHSLKPSFCVVCLCCVLLFFPGFCFFSTFLQSFISGFVSVYLDNNKFKKCKLFYMKNVSYWGEISIRFVSVYLDKNKFKKTQTFLYE